MAENYDESVSALQEEIRVLTEELAQTRELLKEKDALIAELKEQLRKNSQNSSKPLSSDGYRKPRPVTGRKAGAQPGHGLKMPEPDVIEDIAHLPEECEGCPHFGTCPKNAGDWISSGVSRRCRQRLSGSLLEVRQPFPCHLQRAYFKAFVKATRNNHGPKICAPFCGRWLTPVTADTPALPPETVRAFRTRYGAILGQAAAKNPIPVRQPGQRGRVKRGNVRCLIDRLTAHRNEVLLFLEDFRVPFTNNRAEQSLRMVSGCMRTVAGADDFAAIMSFIGSVKKHGINVFSAVKKAFFRKRLRRPFPCTD